MTYTIACVVFSVALVVADLVAGRLTTVVGLVFTSGIVAFPITFVLTDLVHERWGRRAARDMTLMGLGSSVLAFVVVAVATRLPTVPFGVPAEAAATVFGTSMRVIVASLGAFAVSQACDLVVFRHLSRFGFLARATGSTLVSQALDTASFVLLAFAGTLPLPALVSTAIGLYAAKACASFASVPILALARKVTPR